MAQPTRQQQSRVAQARSPIGGDPIGALHLDASGLNPDFDYMWATETVLGADFRENVRLQMQSRAFVPVMVSELPNEAPPLLPGETHGEHALIRRGGQVLMKRPKPIARAERRELADQNAEALRSVNREFEEGIQSRDGMERLKDGGVTERVERRGAKVAFPE